MLMAASCLGAASFLLGLGVYLRCRELWIALNSVPVWRRRTFSASSMITSQNINLGQQMNGFRKRRSRFMESWNCLVKVSTKSYWKVVVRLNLKIWNLKFLKFDRFGAFLRAQINLRNSCTKKLTSFKICMR